MRVADAVGVHPNSKVIRAEMNSRPLVE